MSEGNERNQGTQAQGGQTEGQNVQDQGARLRVTRVRDVCPCVRAGAWNSGGR